MKKDLLKVAVVPLYLKLYEDVAPGLKSAIMPMVEEFIQIISGIADVCALPVVVSPGDVENMRKICGNKDIECIISLHMSYSPSLLCASVFAGLGKPILRSEERRVGKE